jgi:type VII secretion ATPase EccA
MAALFPAEGRTRDKDAAARSFANIVNLDRDQCDMWRAIAFCEPDDVSAEASLRAMYRTLPTFGRLTRPLSDQYAPAVKTGNYVANNHFSDLLEVPYTAPFDIIIPLTNPTRITVAWALHQALIKGDFDDAVSVLEHAPVQTSPHVHLGYALIYWKSRRWVDARRWAEKLFNAPAYHPDEHTTMLAPGGGAGINALLVAAGYLLAGTACAYLGEAELAAGYLATVNSKHIPMTFAEMSREAYRILGLLARARAEDSEATAYFAFAKQFGSTPELDRDADDPTARIEYTSAETIDARTSYWDPSTEPNLAHIQERRRASESSAALGDALAELDKQIGLTAVKEKVHEFAALQMRNKALEEAGIEVGTTQRYNFVFHGAPGTGKTVTARLLARLLYGYGIIRDNRLIEVSAPDLVGSHVGEAEQLTMAKLLEADGALLFVDEVYQLTQKGDEGNANAYGKKAAEAILKYMEDHPDTCHVIIAGYKEETDLFIASNPGFKSRFTDELDFQSYNPNELAQIAQFQAAEQKPPLTIDSDALAHFEDKCKYLMKENAEGRRLVDIAGNGRFARKVVEAAGKKVAVRMASFLQNGTYKVEDLTTITSEDIDAAMDPILRSL